MTTPTGGTVYSSFCQTSLSVFIKVGYKMSAVKSNFHKNGGKQRVLAAATEPLTVAALYNFVRVDNVDSLQKNLLKMCIKEHIRGTLLVAEEGINGTVAGPLPGITTIVQFIKNLPGFAHTDVKYSTSTGAGFHHMRIKIKPEIVTMGKPNIDPTLAAGTYVDPKDWNALISRDDVVVIDTRNAYEIHIGKFQNAVDPKTETFKDFPAWADKLVADENLASTIEPTPGSTSTGDLTEVPTKTPRAVAMYCTGGIRCEKATVYMKQLGVQEVYHLKGGILKYLEEVPARDSLWQGECFVFDERVALKQGLEAGSYTRCFACKMPLSAADTSAENARFEEGVHCTYCVDNQTPAQKERFKERQLQVQLAKVRGEEHVGQHIPAVNS